MYQGKDAVLVCPEQRLELAVRSYDAPVHVDYAAGFGIVVDERQVEGSGVGFMGAIYVNRRETMPCTPSHTRDYSDQVFDGPEDMWSGYVLYQGIPHACSADVIGTRVHFI